MKSQLTRCWIEFDYPPLEAEGIVIGIWHQPHGVSRRWILTTHLRSSVKSSFERDGLDMPPMKEAVENVDVSRLDDHVRPNMHPPNWRGVWYPITRPLS